jgi:hypothetical protein
VGVAKGERKGTDPDAALGRPSLSHLVARRQPRPSQRTQGIEILLLLLLLLIYN